MVRRTRPTGPRLRARSGYGVQVAGPGDDPDEWAFAARFHLVHEWRKFLFTDPALPAALLPLGTVWFGGVAMQPGKPQGFGVVGVDADTLDPFLRADDVLQCRDELDRQTAVGHQH